MKTKYISIITLALLISTQAHCMDPDQGHQYSDLILYQSVPQQPRVPTLAQTAPPPYTEQDNKSPIALALRSAKTGQTRLQNLLLSPENREKNIALIESIGSSKTADRMLLGVAFGMAFNTTKDAVLIAAKNFPATNGIILFSADTALTFLAFFAVLYMNNQLTKQENQLTQLLHELDRLAGDTSRELLPDQPSHPAFTPPLNNYWDVHTSPQETEATLSALHQEYASNINIVRELGSSATKTKMWLLISALFGANALRDAIVYNEFPWIPAVTTAVNGLGAVGSFALAIRAFEQQEDHVETLNQLLGELDELIEKPHEEV